MATITIMDPVTRIEGHMRVDVTIESNKVVDAQCTGTLFRGFETILAGRRPADASVLTQRICGVCPISHGTASVKALDDAVNQTVPDNGRLMRNLTLGANYIQSHILHFYLLCALDYMQGPNSAPWTPAWNVDIRIPTSDPLTTNFVKAVEARRRAHEMGAVFSGRMPTAHTIVPGGFTAVPTAANISAFRTHLSWLRDFIRNIYIPDVAAVGKMYPEYFSIGRGPGNFLAFGVFDLDNAGAQKLFKRGFSSVNGAVTDETVDIAQITETVKHSWYVDSAPVGPSQGETNPLYPKASGYSWLKSPRYKAKATEVGPLARMWVNNDYRRGISVMDRHTARAAEALKVAEAMDGWLNQLQPGVSAYNKGSRNVVKEGVGLTEAPRGALGHWVRIANNAISHYQIITPTCWNASPRDNLDIPGPMEQAIIGTPVSQADQPIEVLRVIHSFDPCLSCAVHVMQPNGKPVVLHARNV